MKKILKFIIFNIFRKKYIKKYVGKSRVDGQKIFIMTYKNGQCIFQKEDGTIINQ